MGGKLYVWGYSDYGGLGLPEEVASNPDGWVVPPVEVPSAVPWESVIGNGQVAFGIKTDGTLWSSGANSYGVLGQGIADESYISWEFAQVGTDIDWVKAAPAGPDVAIALKSNGTLWQTGGDIPTELGTNNTSPVQLGADSDWVDFDTGNNCVIAIKQDGTLWVIGARNSNSIGFQDTTFQTTFRKHEGVTGCSRVFSCTAGSIILMNDSTAYAFGDDWVYGSIDFSNSPVSNTSFQSPEQLFAYTADWYVDTAGWGSFSVGDSYFFGIKSDGTIWAKDKGSASALVGDSAFKADGFFRIVGTLPGWSSVSADGEGYLTLFVHKSGHLFGSGFFNWGGLGVDPLPEYEGRGATSMYRIPIDKKVIAACAGEDCGYAIVVDEDPEPIVLPKGTLFGHGYDWAEELGFYEDGGLYFTTYRPTQPLDVPLGSSSFSVGNGNSFVVYPNGKAYSAGAMSFMGLGPGYEYDESSWVELPGDGWAIIRATRGGDYTYAVKKDGTLWRWGQNELPIQVGGRSDWADVFNIADTEEFVYAITTSGDLYAWGDGFFAFDEDGPIISSTPRLICSGAKKVVGAGGTTYSNTKFAVMLMDNGQVFAAGYNTDNVFGLEAAGLYPRFFEIPGLWSDVDANQDNLVLVDQSGDVYCCGENRYGFLLSNGNVGVTSITKSNVIPKVKSIKLSTGDIAWYIDQDGYLWQSGALFVGTYYTWENPPQRISPYSGFERIEAGYTTVFAMSSADSGAVHFWTNFSGQTEIL